MPQGSFFSYRLRGITIGIVEEDGTVTGVFFGRKSFAGFTKSETPVTKKTAAQIEEYLAGKRKQFNVPFVLRGTEFQKAVWQALQQIPFGETRSYKEIAIAVGRPKAVRAVGRANNRNPVVIIVPCHRVIGHDGSLTGFGGGLPLKRRLLELEGSIALGGQSNQRKNKTDHEENNKNHKSK
jgi:methylated-DNA-[protein]-cysteine S-methyltransferase